MANSKDGAYGSSGGGLLDLLVTLITATGAILGSSSKTLTDVVNAITAQNVPGTPTTVTPGASALANPLTSLLVTVAGVVAIKVSGGSEINLGILPAGFRLDLAPATITHVTATTTATVIGVY